MYSLGKLTSIKDNIMMCLNRAKNYYFFLSSVVYIHKKSSNFNYVAKGTIFEVIKDELKIMSSTKKLYGFRTLYLTTNMYRKITKNGYLLFFFYYILILFNNNRLLIIYYSSLSIIFINVSDFYMNKISKQKYDLFVKFKKKRNNVSNIMKRFYSINKRTFFNYTEESKKEIIKGYEEGKYHFEEKDTCVFRTIIKKNKIILEEIPLLEGGKVIKESSAKETYLIKGNIFSFYLDNCSTLYINDFFIRLGSSIEWSNDSLILRCDDYHIVREIFCDDKVYLILKYTYLSTKKEESFKRIVIISSGKKSKIPMTEKIKNKVLLKKLIL